MVQDLSRPYLIQEHADQGIFDRSDWLCRQYCCPETISCWARSSWFPTFRRRGSQIASVRNRAPSWLVNNEQLETVVRCLLRGVERKGGMPLKCVFDNMTTVVDSRVTSPDGQTQVIWNKRFGQFVIDCGFIPVACWPYRPQQKGSVENLVGFVKGNFFCGRSFKDRANLPFATRRLCEQGQHRAEM